MSHKNKNKKKKQITEQKQLTRYRSSAQEHVTELYFSTTLINVAEIISFFHNIFNKMVVSMAMSRHNF